MAEQKAEKEVPAAAAAPAASGGGKQPLILMALATVNMIFLAGVGFMVFQGKKKEAAEPKIEHVIKGEHEAQEKEAAEEPVFTGKVIPLETFTVNLSGSKGRRIMKVNIELELEGEKAQEEIDKRKAQIRDIIIILLSGKTYDDISTTEGKNHLRDEIRDTVNAFLIKGKIKTVYFTDLVYS